MRPRAVIFDIGGVVVGSPLHAIAEYERDRGILEGSINRVVVENAPAGAWSRLERGELTLQAFFAAFDAECRQAGAAISARDLMERIARIAQPRPLVLSAIRRLRQAGLRVAALTNNWEGDDGASDASRALRSHFDVFVESSAEGLRKPDPRIYQLTCRRLEVAPEEAVFLDDIGGNLKAARALGMATIKVDAPERALAELGELLDLPGLDDPPRDGRARRALSGALAMLCGLFGIGCSAADPVAGIVVQAGVPGARAAAQVRLLGEKADYLDALVSTGGRDYRFFFPDTPDCRALLTGPTPAAYSPLGRGGRLVEGERQCAPAGILNLAQWRKGRGRVAGEMIPRAQASYRVERRDAGVALLRGRFPLVSRLGISGGIDVVAVLPDDARCAAALGSRTASLEYRSSGPEPLILVANGAPCPILGIVFPEFEPEPPKE